MKRVAIVGFGCAGYHAAATMRAVGYGGEIHVFDRALHVPANPMLTTYYVAGKLPYEGMFPFGGMEEIVRRLSLTYHGGCAVTGIRPRERVIVCADGTEACYDGILLATGAEPFRPPVDGADERVFLMRTPEDAVWLRERLDSVPCRKAVVVGASMVGIKVAEALQRHGAETTMVDMQAHMFPIAAYPHVAHEIERRLRTVGVQCIFGASVKAVSEKGAVLNNGMELEADLIGLCIGVRACTALRGADDADMGDVIRVGRGYAVDRAMRTSMQGIYAAGDCCEGYNLQLHENLVLGLWDNARMQGEVAGSNMAGVESRYGGNIIHNITHFFDTDFVGIGDIRRTGEHISTGTFADDNYIEAVIDGDTLCSMNLLGTPRISGVFNNYFKKRMLLPDAAFSNEQMGVLTRYGVERSFLDIIANTKHITGGDAAWNARSN